MTTITAGPRRTAPAIALDPIRRRRGELRPGLWGLTAAMSADWLWIFTGTETAWSGEYLPSGDRVTGKTLMSVRRQAADPGTLDRFTAAARADVDALGDLVTAGAGRVLELAAGGTLFADTAVKYAYARRRLDVLEGRLVAALEPDGVCACGSYLVGDVHCDACPECLELAPGLRIRCELLFAHQACATVDPVLCDHGCKLPARPAPCWRGRDFCCGCCDVR